MSKSNFHVTNYIDDIIGHSVCSEAHKAFDYLKKLLLELGFQLSEKKIATPSAKVTCLGVILTQKISQCQ